MDAVLDPLVRLLGASWYVKCLVICFILSGIHAYFGVHVLTRKVIFLDLALAQIAALGATYALFIGTPGDLEIYLFSIVFTFIGAGVLTLTRTRDEEIPHEAIIGVTYVVAGALSIVLVYLLPALNPDNPEAAHGAEHIRDILTGHMLTASPASVLRAAAVYSGLAVFHWFYREPFFRISEDAEAARAEGLNVTLWDLLFYMSFGLVVSSSVRLAGIFLVFTFLVIPAILAFLFFTTPRSRILSAWAAGFAVSAVGVTIAFHPPSYGGTLLKFPLSPIIVSLFGLVLVGAGLVHHARRAETWGRVLRTYAGVAGIGLALVGLFAVGTLIQGEAGHHGHGEEAHREHDPADVEGLLRSLESADPTIRRTAVEALGELIEEHPEAADALPRHVQHEDDPEVRRAIYRVLGREGSTDSQELLLRRFPAEAADPALQLTIARALDRSGHVAGVRLRIEILAEMGLDASEAALEDLTRLTGGETFGYDPRALIPSDEAVARWREWFETHRDDLNWDEDAGRFVAPGEDADG